MASPDDPETPDRNPSGEAATTPTGAPAKLPRPRRLPLGQVTLSGKRLRIHQAAMLLLGLASVIAIITHFMPQHRVVSSADLGGAFCWAPDCHVDPVTSYDADGPSCTGFDHGGILPPLYLFAMLLLAIYGVMRPSWPAGMGAALTTFLGWIAALIAIFDLDHMFEKVVTLWPEDLFAVCFIGIFFHGLVNLVLQPVLYVGQRRKLESDLEVVPRAQVRASRWQRLFGRRR